MTVKPARKAFFLIILLILQFLLPLRERSLAAASTIFIDDSNSSSSESGTITNPFNTIQEGIDAVTAGGTLSVAEGSYLDIFLTEDNSNITLVCAGHCEVGTGLFAAGLSSNRLKDVAVESFQFTGGYSDIFLVNADTITITNSKVEDGFQGLTLIDVKNSNIRGNIFYQNWVNLVLEGDLSGTEIRFNDFIPTDGGIQIDTSELNLPGTMSLPYNWWGSAEEPSVIDKVDRNKWLVATKDEGKPNSGYSYEGDNGRVEISGGTGSTANIYVGKYYSTLEAGVNPVSDKLMAVGSYYDFVTDGGTISWPITITISYQETELPTGLSEAELQGLYYFKDGFWKLYGSDLTDDSGTCYSNTSVDTEKNTITATICHLTPIVAGGEQDAPTSTPTPTPTPTPTSASTAAASSTSSTTTSSSSSSQSGSEENTDTTQIDLQAANIAEVIDPILDFLEVKPETILEEFVSEGEVLGEEVVEKTASQPKEIKAFPVKELIIAAVLISVFSYLLRRSKII